MPDVKTMKRLAGRKQRHADELTVEDKTREEIAAELEVSPTTLYNRRRSYGEMCRTRRRVTGGQLRHRIVLRLFR